MAYDLHQCHLTATYHLKTPPVATYRALFNAETGLRLLSTALLLLLNAAACGARLVLCAATCYAYAPARRHQPPAINLHFPAIGSVWYGKVQHV